MKTTIDIANFAIVRSPLLPLSIFQEWRESNNPDEFILSLYDQPLVDEALYLSSMSLHARLQELRKGEGEAAQHHSEYKKLIGSLAKFISRAAYRCTPFGLFAQVQLARFSESNSEVNLLSDETPLRKVHRGIHLDGAVEARLVERALADLDYREQLKWQMSSTAFAYGTHLSYVDWVYQANWQRTYRAVELELNDALLVLKNHCQEPLAFQEVCNLLTSDPDINYEEAREFVHELIARRLLLPDLAPSCSNACSFDQSLTKSSEHPALLPLRNIQQLLHSARHKADSAESLVPEYQALYRNVEEYVGEKNLSLGVVQIDSLVPNTVDINTAHGKTLARSVQLIATHCVRSGVAMQNYKSLFRERFEDREINLAYALHSELGLPYPDRGVLESPLLDGFPKAGGFGYGGSGGAAPTPLDHFLIRTLLENATKPNQVIKVSVEDLEKMGATSLSRSTFAEGLYAQVNIHPTSAQQAPAFELRGIGGRNGLEFVARFAHLSTDISAAAQEFYRDFSRHEDDCIYAEIIHHPQDRILNITRKPRLSEYDLVIAGASELPRSQQFWLEDLTIQLSDDRFILRDQKTGKQVIPRLTSAHNYSAPQLGTYQFLASMQDDDAAWVGFYWPQAVENLDYLPRVEIAGVIVARARWLLKKEAIVALNQALVAGTLMDWRAEHKLPRFISLDHGDNHLPVDLENLASTHMLLDEIIKSDSVHVYENLTLSLAQENQLWEHHAQEWIVPLQLHVEESESEKQKRRTSPPLPRHITAEGAICPNLDEWAYFRVYTGSGYADRVISECVGSVLCEARESGLIDRWFFIRFKDRFEHLRIRFHSPHQADLIATMVKLQSRLKLARQDGLLWCVQTDDYVLEEVRYGGKAGLSICEQLFTLDSEDLIALLNIEAQFSGEHDRWVYAMASIDHYAQRLCPETTDREKFLDTLAENYLNEHSTPQTRSEIIVGLGGKFRDMRKQFDVLRTGTPALNAWKTQLLKQSQARDALLKELDMILGDSNTEKKSHILQSLMHMHCNRLAPSDPRKHETILYDFAKRLERARQAKQRSAKQVQA